LPTLIILAVTPASALLMASRMPDSDEFAALISTLPGFTVAGGKGDFAVCRGDSGFGIGLGIFGGQRLRLRQL
jgi:hypothetical protein